MRFWKTSVIKANIDWKEYIGHFEKVQKEQLIGSIASEFIANKK